MWGRAPALGAPGSTEPDRPVSPATPRTCPQTCRKPWSLSSGRRGGSRALRPPPTWPSCSGPSAFRPRHGPEELPAGRSLGLALPDPGGRRPAPLCGRTHQGLHSAAAALAPAGLSHWPPVRSCSGGDPGRHPSLMGVREPPQMPDSKRHRNLGVQGPREGRVPPSALGRTPALRFPGLWDESPSLPGSRKTQQ